MSLNFQTSSCIPRVLPLNAPDMDSSQALNGNLNNNSITLPNNNNNNNKNLLKGEGGSLPCMFKNGSSSSSLAPAAGAPSPLSSSSPVTNGDPSSSSPPSSSYQTNGEDSKCLSATEAASPTTTPLAKPAKQTVRYDSTTGKVYEELGCPATSSPLQTSSPAANMAAVTASSATASANGDYFGASSSGYQGTPYYGSGAAQQMQQYMGSFGTAASTGGGYGGGYSPYDR